MKKLITLILIASFALIGACSKKGYNNSLISRNSGNFSSDSDTGSLDETTTYNTTWSGVSSNLTTSDNDKRAIANFYGYNTFHYTKKYTVTLPFGGGTHYFGAYGYKSETSYTGDVFDSNDFLRNYFNFDAISSSLALKASPAPKNIGDVYNAKVIFKANIDEATEEILTDSAYLYIEFETEAKTLKVSFNNLDSMVLNSGSYDLRANFSDGCGTVVLEANLASNGSSYDLVGIHISYVNSASSYKDSSCYYNGASGIVWGLAKTFTFPNRLPDGLDYTSRYPIINNSEDTIVLEQE